ncbi:MAG: UDP-glucose/GDP-mannose dehydrogenase family protein [Fidelibacterota bacterium]|nr:MAG: UDP-glucose/GDP-mannose dehydrogenase family protein [Candidatus Neomarinimicrobiota bacterium]
MKVSIIGTGYVGLVTGACFAYMGNQVICVDIDSAKIDALNRAVIPIYEPGLKELIEGNLREGRLAFTTDTPKAVRESEIIFIAVGTPMDEDGSADLKHVLDTAQAIGEGMDGYRAIVVKSTVPLGSCERVNQVIQEVLDKRGVEFEFDVVSNPEFLKEGKAVSDFMSPDRVVIGTDSQRVRELMHALYESFFRVSDRILFMDTRSAELTKYAANAMLATRLSFMNELAALCEATGADVEHVRIGIGSDQRIGRRYLFPGLGYGGSCLPKDVQALISTAEELGVGLKILRAVDQVNQKQKALLMRKIEVFYSEEGLIDKTFALWGLSFKPDTDDVRESPAAKIIEGLLEKGARIRAYDPVAIESFRDSFTPPIDYSDDMYRCLSGADALILVTEWHHFRHPDFSRMKAELNKPVIFDGRNQYEPEHLRQQGFFYISIGRQPIGPGVSGLSSSLSL